MNQVTLPDKPSELLAIALEDLELCENDPVYVIDMGKFHTPDESEGKCHVCLAGAILAMRVNIPPSIAWTEAEFEFGVAFAKELSEKIFAIDSLRRGSIRGAESFLNIVIPVNSRTMPYYGEPDFKPAIRQLITDLAKVGC